jgi:hypothetical protein
MSGTKYNRYPRPMMGNVLILPFPDEKLSQFMTGKLNEQGVVTDVDQPILNPMRKGIVVEKGPDNPGDPSQIKRKDVVMFARGEGSPLRLATQVGEEEPMEREFIMMSANCIIAIV